MASIASQNPLNFVSTTSDPTVIDGDVWYRTDLEQYRARSNGATCNLCQAVFATTTSNTTVTGGAGVTAISNADITIPNGTWHIRVQGAYTLSSSTSTTTRIRFSGTTSVVQYRHMLMSNSAGFIVSNTNTSLSSDLGSSTNTGPMYFHFEGILTVTGAGTFGLSATKATSGTMTVEEGTFCRAERWA